jgi:hypothetical protein
MKQKVFFCLLLQNRLNTRELLQRKNMVLDSYACELCLLQRLETLRHLFLLCPFAKKYYWASIGVLVPSWECSTLLPLGMPFNCGGSGLPGSTLLDHGPLCQRSQSAWCTQCLKAPCQCKSVTASKLCFSRTSGLTVGPSESWRWSSSWQSANGL